ncbi:hypothetical protein GOP47_0011311 [Adiantum capillus-veneris]|uniref:BTB domain-containing protein n=1 Tax=Adiantum capillus-veneris TaxID=13818 RepID=A0A9D4ZFA4_ADICA|nr:hypothetical protein GOP47_0011311 [Adiantum capillus-veneris]
MHAPVIGRRLNAALRGLSLMLSFATYPSSESSPASSASSSPLEWAEWMPECLRHPAIAIATEMSSPSYPHHLHEEDEDDDEDDDDDEEPITADDDDLDNSASVSDEEEEGTDLEEEEEEGDEDGEDNEEEEGGAAQQQGVNQEEDMDVFSDDDDIAFGHLRRQRYHQQNRLQATHGQHGNQSNRSLACLSCKETYTSRRAGTCRECYDEASETEEALKKEIEELHARIAFLKTWAPEAMEENCADISLECVDGSKIRAHRAVLISRSTVFKAMLENKMEESRTNTIRITDFTYDVLRLFVHYLYTAEIYPESLEDCAVDLLALAEKYNVKQLKLVCERYMISKLNCGNAISNFEYASLHGAKNLKQAALSTIMDNIQDLIGKTDYLDLVNRDAKLVVEIFESYLSKQTVKGSTH